MVNALHSMYNTNILSGIILNSLIFNNTGLKPWCTNKNIFTNLVKPLSAAKWIGVLCSLSPIEQFALAMKSTLKQPSSPWIHVRCITVWPSVFWVSTWAPASIRVFIRAESRLLAARCIAVSARGCLVCKTCSWLLTLSSSLQMLLLPDSMALKSGMLPQESSFSLISGDECCSKTFTI